jgi:subtilase family serine protease
MAPGLSKVQVYVGKQAASVLNQMASDNTSKQLSSSWGWAVDASAVDPIFKEFQAQGQSFLDATGDYGYRLKLGGVWPADDANVTAVGGTTLVTNGAGGSWKSEAGWSSSGGGPSPDKQAVPSYQVPFINASNKGSTTLRNVPDISGVASNFYVCANGTCNTGWGGTSFAAPSLAGFVALANQQAVAQGHAVVGWLNPTLYKLGAGAGYATEFHDQTTGNNGKYNNVTGFDLVTGFGSPQGQTLINALIKGN